MMVCAQGPAHAVPFKHTGEYPQAVVRSDLCNYLFSGMGATQATV